MNLKNYPIATLGFILGIIVLVLALLVGLSVVNVPMWALVALLAVAVLL